MFSRILRYASFYLSGSQEYDLNVITNPEWVIAVIEDIEGVKSAWGTRKKVQEAAEIAQDFPLQDYLPETQKEMIEENHVVHTIYGGYGLNRYKVRLNGDIEFSGFHAASPEHLEKAKSLGMKVFE